MSRRRTTRFAALSVLLSFVGTLLVSAPAHATDVDKRIGYHCSSPYGGGNSRVRIRVSFPDHVVQGVEVPSRKVRFRIRVPAALVDVLRSYGVDSISGHGRAHYTVGTLVRPIRKLHLPEKEIPATGGMTLHGSGRAAEFYIGRAGTYKVKVTRSLTATVTAHGGPGDGQSVDLTCNVRRGESRTLASIEVIR